MEDNALETPLRWGGQNSKARLQGSGEASLPETDDELPLKKTRKGHCKQRGMAPKGSGPCGLEGQGSPSSEGRRNGQ